MRFPFSSSAFRLVLALFLLAGVFLAGAARLPAASPYVLLGPSDGIALDQPRVAVAVVDPATGNNLGPDFSNTFLLDTGANGILVGGNAFNELRSSGYQTVAQYDDIGIGGTATMDVSKPYELNFAGDNGIPLALSNVRLMSNADADVGFDGIVGTPAMMGRTTDLDMTVWSGGNFDTLRTSFSNAAPPVAPAQYHVPLSLQDFPATGQHNPSDPLPTFAPLLTAPVQAVNQNHAFDGRFIVDTGAQISIISTATALALGINPETDAVDALDLSGIAGTVTVPIINVDSLALKTTEGVNLMWTGLQLGVYDIDPSIAGIFGMDFLTSGWLETLFGGDDGYLDHVYFDFRNYTNHIGTMVLNVNPALNHVIAAPLPADANHDGIVNGQDIALVASNWLHTGVGTTGDLNGDAIVNGQDLALIASNWLKSSGSASAAAVPEPATCGAALSAFVMLLLSGRFKRAGRGDCAEWLGSRRRRKR